MASLGDIGKRKGLSASFLSQLELGQVSPSRERLESIATALNVPIAYFFDDETKVDSVMIRKVDRNRIYSQGAKAFIQPLTNQLSMKRIEPYMLTLGAGGESGEGPYPSHHREKFGIVLQGEIRFVLGKNECVLRDGDGVYFNSNKPHKWRIIGKEETNIILAIQGV